MLRQTSVLPAAISQICDSPNVNMRPFTSTISLDEARRRLDAACGRSRAPSACALAEAAGRVAAADVASSIDVPPFARSAMDGYAVVAADTAGATP